MGIAACGDDSDSSPPSGGESGSESTEAPPASDGDAGSGASASGDAVEIVEFLYDPEDLTVPAGTTVTWTNQDQAPHTATAEDSSFDTDTLQKGDAGEVTLDDPGTYAYYCRFHRFMEATVTVE